MRVRGWYWPGARSSSASSIGVPAGVAARSALEEAVGPSNASRPRPRPLGFLVTMGPIVRNRGAGGYGARRDVASAPRRPVPIGGENP